VLKMGTRFSISSQDCPSLSCLMFLVPLLIIGSIATTIPSIKVYRDRVFRSLQQDLRAFFARVRALLTHELHRIRMIQYILNCITYILTRFPALNSRIPTYKDSLVTCNNFLVSGSTSPISKEYAWSPWYPFF
jgi:hypothetical protein